MDDHRDRRVGDRAVPLLLGHSAARLGGPLFVIDAPDPAREDECDARARCHRERDNQREPQPGGIDIAAHAAPHDPREGGRQQQGRRHRDARDASPETGVGQRLHDAAIRVRHDERTGQQCQADDGRKRHHAVDGTGGPDRTLQIEEMARAVHRGDQQGAQREHLRGAVACLVGAEDHRRVQQQCGRHGTGDSRWCVGTGRGVVGGEHGIHAEPQAGGIFGQRHGR